MKKLLTTTIILTFILFLWGALVRSAGAGLACPDWPLCHGQIIPPFTFPIFLEWGHRMLASIVGFCTLGIVIMAFRKPYRRQLALLSVITLVFLLVQAGLGGAAIMTKLSPGIIGKHLAVGTLFLMMLLWMRLRLSDPLRSPVPWSAPLFVMLLITLILVFLQSLLGSVVAASHAGLACPDFPTCQGEWIPSMEGLVGLHFTHRVGAFIVLIAVIILTALGKKAPQTKRWKLLLWHIVRVTVIQLLLGISNIVYELPTWVKVSHLGMATVLFALLFITTYEVRRARVLQSHQTAH